MNSGLGFRDHLGIHRYRSRVHRSEQLGFRSVVPCRGGGSRIADEIGDAVVGFKARQQLHARGQIVVDLALVVPALALALREDHVGDGTGVQVGELLRVIIAHLGDVEGIGSLHQTLVDDAVHLLAVIAGLLGLARLEPLAFLALRMVVQFTEQGLGLPLPRHTAMLGDLPCGLLVHHGAFQTGQGGIDLGDHIAALDEIERDLLNIVLGELDALTLIQLVRALEESIHLDGIISPLALRSVRDSRCVLIGLRFLPHWLSTSYNSFQHHHFT